jgi:uncharacterized membrane protein
MYEYILYFFIFSVLGWLWERVIMKNDEISCGDTIVRKISICMPILLIYGFGGMLLLFIKRNIIKRNILSFAFISGILLTLFECIGGQISFYINKYRTWYYDTHPLNICNGYISLPVFLFWVLCAGIFYKFDDILNDRIKQTL